MSIRSNNTRDHRQEPTYWFAILEIAREKGDVEQSAEAERELERLGVHVSYGPPRQAGAK